TVEFSNNERTPTQDTHTGHPTSGQPLHLTISSVSPPEVNLGEDRAIRFGPTGRLPHVVAPCRSASDRPWGRSQRCSFGDGTPSDRRPSGPATGSVSVPPLRANVRQHYPPPGTPSNPLRQPLRSEGMPSDLRFCRNQACAAGGREGVCDVTYLRRLGAAVIDTPRGGPTGPASFRPGAVLRGQPHPAPCGSAGLH